MRKLGIPCVKDKVVQEAMRMILEAIYDSPQGAYFSDDSHGFRQTAVAIRPCENFGENG